ncbi:MAG TPA: hypothetical protein VJV05_11305 [Pyrinomonadaceae bacterium]|nr:hypothetical protein [Pyrinomonadaceae bacterium]
MKRIPFTVILFLTSTVAVVSQETPKAELLDEFPAQPCEFILASVDALAHHMQVERMATIAIVIYRPVRNPERAGGIRRLISSALRLRRADQHRYRFFLADKSPDEEIRTKFWSVPPGATPPTDGAAPWDEVSPDVSRQFMFGYVDETDICPTYVPNAFAKLLLDNPGSIGRIVVTTSVNPIVERFSFARGFIDDLVVRHGVPRKRLRLTFRESKEETGAEFWFVPASKSPSRGRRTGG